MTARLKIGETESLSEFFLRQFEESMKDPVYRRMVENYDDMPDTSKWFTEEELAKHRAYDKMLCEQMEARLAAKGIIIPKE